jgi:phospholipid transport system substrate-binding protein
VTKKGSEIPVNYRMTRKGDRWLVYDVKIEELSLVSNFRKQFDRVIRQSSYEELVKKMKTRQDEFLEESKAKRTSQR